jgi:hypothetical protein
MIPLQIRLPFIAALCAAALLSGCSFEKQSDWQWRQWNPNYRSPVPAAEESGRW